MERSKATRQSTRTAVLHHGLLRYARNDDFIIGAKEELQPQFLSTFEVSHLPRDRVHKRD